MTDWSLDKKLLEKLNSEGPVRLDANEHYRLKKYMNSIVDENKRLKINSG